MSVETITTIVRVCLLVGAVAGYLLAGYAGYKLFKLFKGE